MRLPKKLCRFIGNIKIPLLKINWMTDKRIRDCWKVRKKTRWIFSMFQIKIYLQKKFFVFTPKGEMRTLPANATALDFAFDIHTR